MEATELHEYARHCPLDDQSNHHLPIAMLHASLRNIMGGTAKASDFMIYRDTEADGDIEFMQQLLGSDLIPDEGL